MVFNKFYLTLDKNKLDGEINYIINSIGYLENKIEGIKKDYPFLKIDVEIRFDNEKLRDWIAEDVIKVDKYFDQRLKKSRVYFDFDSLIDAFNYVSENLNRTR